MSILLRLSSACSCDFSIRFSDFDTGFDTCVRLNNNSTENLLTVFTVASHLHSWHSSSSRWQLNRAAGEQQESSEANSSHSWHSDCYKEN
jgi:hypothetical protein